MSHWQKIQETGDHSLVQTGLSCCSIVKPAHDIFLTFGLRMNEVTPLTTSYFTSSFSGCELPKLQELTQKQGSTLDNDDWLCLAQMKPVFSQPFFIRKRKLCCKDALCS